MYVNIQNEGYGYAVTTYGDYVVVSNPPTTLFDALTPTVFHTGSIDFYRYNKNTDQHDFISPIYKNFVNVDVLLTRETGSNILNRDPLHTEVNNAGITQDKDLQIDKNNYTSSWENGFGLSVDMYNKFLVVGSPYYSQSIQTYAFSILLSGSAVDIFDLGKTEIYPFDQNPYVASLENPTPSINKSFGLAVSINNDWIAVGSPLASGSTGFVYMYRSGSGYTWTLQQVLTGSISGSMFGHSLKLNKQSGSISGSMVVGCGNISTNKAYYYEYISGSWMNTYTFLPDKNIHPLTFGNYQPYSPTMNTSSGFGSSVSLFGNSVIVGSYLDRTVYEYSGSSLYQQGSAYIFEKCINYPTTLFELVLKTYGTSSIMKNNRLGYSVDIFGNNAIVGIPKINNDIITTCYIQGTLNQIHQCTFDLEKSLTGQSLFLQKNTSSNDWEITNIYQRKKKYLSPYRNYGNSVSIADRSMVVGAPMLLSNAGRVINTNITSSQDVELDDITGKSYIYNLKNLRPEFHIGNVFYRNGKIVVMTSGSIFDGLFYNPTRTNNYEYDINFKSQHTIFEKQIVCTVDPGEFNVSTNPTAIFTATSSLDINKNGIFDYQDLDVILRYMQYKNTLSLGGFFSTDWSSSIVESDDEKSVLNYYTNFSKYDEGHTFQMVTESINKWEYVDTSMQNILDFNEDNKIDIRDMNIIWKYFTNRLTQDNYSSYITPSCNRNLFSDIIDYMNFLSQKTSKPQIKSTFLDYERLSLTDKTGSFLAPMVTTIGLYSGVDLVSVAKLGSPIKITNELPINFIIKMDY